MTAEIETLSKLALEVEGHQLVAPCVEACLYFRHTPPELARGFAEAALAALDADLTRFLSGQMRRFAPRGKKSEANFAALFDRPRIGGQYWMVLRGGEGEGTDAAELEVNYHPPPPLPETEAETEAAIADNRHRFEDRGAIYTPHVSIIRATFPLHHPLAQPEALRDWFAALPAIREGVFISAHAGYALNYDRAVGPRPLRQAMQAAMASALARHIGLGYENIGAIGRKLLKYWPHHAEFLPRFKRVQWLTAVQGVMLDELVGGRGPATEKLASHPDLHLTELGPALLVQAGGLPRIGDVSSGDDLPAYRAAAQILAPGRLPQMEGIGAPFSNEAAQRWLEALERPA